MAFQALDPGTVVGAPGTPENRVETMNITIAEAYFYSWAIINLVWSAVLTIATARVFFISRQLERKFELRARWLAEQQRKQRQL